MRYKEIKKAIEARVVTYSTWTIGLTDDPDKLKDELQYEKKIIVDLWEHWKTDSGKVAIEIVEYFLKKGMNGGTGDGYETDYVYIVPKQEGRNFKFPR